MNKRLFLVFILLASMNLKGIAQLQPIKNVPTPEIANLGDYGKVPVSLYTGIPDISVPLYELKAGNFTLPLSVSYHLASVKPNVQPGCLGLGWSLQVGGYITRSVHGLYDEKCESNGYASGYYAHASELQNMNNEQFVEATKHIQAESGNYYELSADEFSFSFCGYSGNFYYKGNGQWHVVSDQDIKVEFNPANGEGFINAAQLETRIPLNGWNVRSQNNRFFNKFTLVTPDGSRYEFGGLQATEYSAPYYARSNGDLIPTSWKLSKITTADKRVVEFSYDTSQVMCDLKYVPQHKIVTGIPCTPQNPQIGQGGMTGYLIFPATLKTIKTPNETLEFNYYNDYGYSDCFVDNYLAWGRRNFYGRNDIYSFMEDPATQFHVFLGGGIDASSDYMLRETIKAKLKNQVLHSIYIKGNAGRPLKTIYFDYVYELRRKLALITERPGNPEIIPHYIWHPHGYYILTRYDIPETGIDQSVPEYRFLYHSETTMPYDYVRPRTDSWGYYTGGSVGFADMPDFSPKSASLKYTMAEVLTDIIYPTGGKSHFEYELNTYSKVVSPSRTSLTDKSGTAGGLRVQRITNRDSEDNVLGVKQYYYSDTRQPRAKCSGILKSLPVNEIVYRVKNSGTALYLKSEGGFFASVTNLNTPDVGYSCVIEETLDKDGVSQGYVLRRYSNYDTDIYGNAHPDDPAFYSMLEGESYTMSFSSRSMERGKLLSEEFYDAGGGLRKEVKYRYKEVNPASFVTADQRVLFFCTDADCLSFAKVGTLTRTYTHAYLPDSVKEILYPRQSQGTFVVEKEYQYNKYKQPSRVTTTNSDGKNTRTEYVYAALLPEYKWMEERHILSPVAEKKEQTGDCLVTERYDYKTPFPFASRMSVDRNGHVQTRYEVEATDDYGNPVYLRENSMPVVQIWGGAGQRLMARIENATLDEVEKALGMSAKSFSSLGISSARFKSIEDIRSGLSRAHCHIYQYTDELRLLSETIPNGNTVFYKYDFLGRLVEKYIMEANGTTYRKGTLNVYDYHYYNTKRWFAQPETEATTNVNKEE